MASDRDRVRIDLAEGQGVNEAAIGQFLQEHCGSDLLYFQAVCQPPYLSIYINYEEVLAGSLDATARESLARSVQKTLQGQSLPKIEYLAVYTRIFDTVEPDWETMLPLLDPVPPTEVTVAPPDPAEEELDPLSKEIAAGVAAGEEIPPPEGTERLERELDEELLNLPDLDLNGSGGLLDLPELSGELLEDREPAIAEPEEITVALEPLDDSIEIDDAELAVETARAKAPPLELVDYCFIRNKLLLAAQIQPPPVETARLVRSFHDLCDPEKACLLPLLQSFFLNPDNPPYFDELPQNLQAWARALPDPGAPAFRKGALWLSRYCYAPTDTLAIVDEILASAPPAPIVPAKLEAPTPAPAAVPSDEMLTVAPIPTLANYCFTRSRALLVSEIAPPTENTARRLQAFDDFTVAEQLQILPLLQDFFAGDRVPAVATLPPNLRQWWQTLPELETEDARKLAIWLSRYCHNPEKTRGEIAIAPAPAPIPEPAPKPAPKPTPQSLLTDDNPTVLPIPKVSPAAAEIASPPAEEEIAATAEDSGIDSGAILDLPPIAPELDPELEESEYALAMTGKPQVLRSNRTGAPVLDDAEVVPRETDQKEAAADLVEVADRGNAVDLVEVEGEFVEIGETKQTERTERADRRPEEHKASQVLAAFCHTCLLPLSSPISNFLLTTGLPMLVLLILRLLVRDRIVRANAGSALRFAVQLLILGILLGFVANSAASRAPELAEALSIGLFAVLVLYNILMVSWAVVSCLRNPQRVFRYPFTG